MDQNNNNIQISSPKTIVNIIGAGPSGILNLKYLSQLKDPNLILQAFEYKSDIGGLWNYVEQNNQEETSEDKIQKDQYYQLYKGLNSSIYDGMQTNIPKCLMSYKGFPLNSEIQDFPTQQEYQDYLQQYSDHFQLKKYIKFEVLVYKIRLTENLSTQEIECIYKDHKDQFNISNNKNELESLEEFQNFLKQKKILLFYQNKNCEKGKFISLCDYLVVANGHYQVPQYPLYVQDYLKEQKCKQKQEWQGIIDHAHYFRQYKLSQWKGKTITIQGVRLSGQDLLCQILKQPKENLPKKVYFVGNINVVMGMKLLSKEYREEIDSGLLVLIPKLIKELVPNSNNIKLIQTSINNNSSQQQNNNNKCEGDSIEDVDILLLCTGYQHNIPFFEEKDNIVEFYNSQEHNKAFGPLYKSLVCINVPQIFFPGLINGFIQVQGFLERQAIVVSRIISKKASVPSKKEMMESFQNHRQLCFNSRSDLYTMFQAHNGELILPQYLYDLIKLGNIEENSIDEEYEKLTKTIAPQMYSIIFDGNYPQLKTKQIQNKFVKSDYAPKENYF